jgi:hypothetical protein
MVELNLTHEEARLMWCQGIRARKIGKKAIEEQNIAKLAESWAWFDMFLITISQAAPEEAGQNPDGTPLTGIETSKP